MVTPFPYARTRLGQKRVGRMEFRASLPEPPDALNERRHRAELERALRAGDDAIAQLERRVKALESYINSNVAFTAYGQLSVDTPNAFPDLSTTWQTVTSFDESSGVNLQADHVTDTVVFERAGTYWVTLSGVIEHNESNAGREFYIRMVNVADPPLTVDQPGVPIATGRNQPSTSFSRSLLVQITDADVAAGDTYGVQIRSTDVYTGVIIDAMNLVITNLSSDVVF